MKTAEALATRLARPFGGANVALIDVRPVEDYPAGHIRGARQIDPDAMAAPDAPVGGALRPVDGLARMLGELGVWRDVGVVLDDDKGGFHAAQ